MQSFTLLWICSCLSTLWLLIYSRTIMKTKTSVISCSMIHWLIFGFIYLPGVVFTFFGFIQSSECSRNLNTWRVSPTTNKSEKISWRGRLHKLIDKVPYILLTVILMRAVPLIHLEVVGITQRKTKYLYFILRLKTPTWEPSVAKTVLY